MMISDTGGAIDAEPLPPPKLESFLLVFTALYPQGYMEKIRPPSHMSLLDWHLTELFDMDKEKKYLCGLGCKILKVWRG
jgi:hypothetical protein